MHCKGRMIVSKIMNFICEYRMRCEFPFFSTFSLAFSLTLSLSQCKYFVSCIILESKPCVLILVPLELMGFLVAVRLGQSRILPNRAALQCTSWIQFQASCHLFFLIKPNKKTPQNQPVSHRTRLQKLFLRTCFSSFAPFNP